MRYFYLANKEVTEIDGSEAWAIVEELPNGRTHLYQIGFRNKQAEAKTKNTHTYIATVRAGRPR